MFQFKQFTIQDDRCAMKVGTDGVLLGAWADCGLETARILDVGTGSGLIALMLAQRFAKSHVVALEIDEQATQQAQENVDASPFKDRVTVLQEDFASAALEIDDMDMIVSNPPYYDEDVLPPNDSRAIARNTQSGLNFRNLITKSYELLRETGTLCVIIPKVAQTRFHTIANEAGFSLVHQLDIQTVERKDPKRVLLKFIKGRSDVSVFRETLVLMENGHRSPVYSALCQDFYL